MGISPDVTPFVDLTIYDQSAFDLVNRALQYATTYLPEWIPRAGNVEVTLIEALAVQVMEMVFAINRLPAGVVQYLLKALFNVPQDLGAPPTATVTFTVSDALGHTIPAGSVVQLALGSPTFPQIAFQTDAALVIAPASTTGTASVTATANTDQANGVNVGAQLTVLSSQSFVEAAVLASSPTGGRNAEDGNTYVARAAINLQRLTQALVLPTQFQAAAAQTPGVFRALAVQNWDASASSTLTGTAQPYSGSVLGSIAVLVYGQGGVALSSAAKTALQASLDAMSFPALNVVVADPTIVTLDVTTTVSRFTTTPAATVQANVVAAVDGYVSSDTWAWAQTLNIAALTAVIDRAAGVSATTVLTFGAATISADGLSVVLATGNHIPLIKPGTVTVTVSN